MHSGERLSAADGLDSAEWEEAAWSGSDDGDELDQLEVWCITYDTPHRSLIWPNIMT